MIVSLAVQIGRRKKKKKQLFGDDISYTEDQSQMIEDTVQKKNHTIKMDSRDLVSSLSSDLHGGKDSHRKEGRPAKASQGDTTLLSD